MPELHVTILINQINKLFSRQFLYHQERVLEHTVNQDAGAQMREIGRTLGKYGVCEEEYMPYDDKGYLQTPSEEAFKNALQHRITRYHSVKGLTGIKQALSQSKPVLIGISVFESFESKEVARTGIVPMPQAHEENLGGHAVLAVGYDDEKQVVIVRNSWGADWGDEGYFYLPYEFVKGGYAFDFWVLDK
jgi:C1A family cysteine protease